MMREKPLTIQLVYISNLFQLASPGGSHFLNYILKNLFERARPDDFCIVAASGYSFPQRTAIGRSHPIFRLVFPTSPHAPGFHFTGSRNLAIISLA